MKKILSTLILIFLISTNCYANTDNLTFMYINGSNNNDTKMRDWYLSGVKNLHPTMKNKFEKNKTIRKWYKDDKLVINPEPEIFFWGYDSKTDLEYVQERLDISKAYSSFIAYEVRSMLTQFLHDALWVQKDHNMLPILDEINDRIKTLADEGQSVILFGYSAGAFVTYQYMIYKMPYINFEEFSNAINADSEIKEFMKQNPRQDTCLSAIMHDKGSLGVLSNTGHFILWQDKDLLKQNYLNLDKATELYCAPKDKVKGVVNFASPVPLFYSDVADKNYSFSYYNENLSEYILENNMYFLTVNYREDPLAFPTNENLTIPQYKELLGDDLENPIGVIYDNSKVWSRRLAIFAHTSYWSAKNVFSKAVVKSFVDGTRFLYDENFQKKAVKKRNFY